MICVPISLRVVSYVSDLESAWNDNQLFKQAQRHARIGDELEPQDRTTFASNRPVSHVEAERTGTRGESVES